VTGQAGEVSGVDPMLGAVTERVATSEPAGSSGSVAARASRSTDTSPSAFLWSVPLRATTEENRIARRRWYGGAGFALIWQALVVIALWSDGGSLSKHLMGSIGLGIIYASFLFAPTVLWRGTMWGRVLGLVLFTALSFAMIGFVGPVVVWVWVLISSLSGFVAARGWIALAINLLVVAAQVVVSASVGWGEAANQGFLFSPLITASVAASMLFFGRQRQAEEELGVAQDEITRLAVVEERARFSRDLHDVLGHSLTVVTMKSELAGRLVDIDPERAKVEIADIERLSREALQGLRQAVSGYRQADLSAELVSARAAFEAAGIDATLPASGDVCAKDVRSLFAWVLREGVTNVLRHAGASRARVTLTRTELTIEDDGVSSSVAAGGGADGSAAVGGGADVSDGNGLRGLRERADAVGATLTTGTSDLGGFLLRVTRGAGARGRSGSGGAPSAGRAAR
jgi:two-component system, NarL family, sensor histidine kinase DesK